MIKVTIFKNGIATHSASFKEQSQVNVWLSDVNNIKAWGGAGNYHHTEEFAPDVDDSEKALRHGERCVAFVRAVNSRKLNQGEWTAQKFLEFISNQHFQDAERYLWQGSFQMARQSLANIPSGFYSQQDIQSLNDLILEY